MDRGVDVSELPERLTGVMHFCPIDQNLLHITDKPLPNDGDDARRPDWVDRPNPMAEDETEETSDTHEVGETNADSADNADDAHLWKFRWYCLTCDYTCPIRERVRIYVPLEPKEQDRIVGGEEEWATAQTTNEVLCEKCGNRGAFYREMQTRSADEPMTQFFKCKKCGSVWKGG